MVDGLEGVGEIGPIPVTASDTIEQVEAKVQAWIEENVADFAAPLDGVLGLAFDGRSLKPGASLLDEQIPDMATFNVPPKPGGGGTDEEGEAAPAEAKVEAEQEA